MSQLPMANYQLPEGELLCWQSTFIGFEVRLFFFHVTVTLGFTRIADKNHFAD